jgi:uncharacterized membrane protein YbjE (DUF340 family)
MDSFIQILVLVAFLAGGAVLQRIRLAPPPGTTDIIIKLVLGALLLAMGFRLGNARELSSRLGEIGLLAAATAVLALAGTVLAIRLAYLPLDAFRAARLSDKRQFEARDSHPVREPGDQAVRPAGFDWQHFKGPAVLLGIVVLGFMAGMIAPEFGGLDYGQITGWVLNALLFMIGVQFAQSGLSLGKVFLRADTLLVPLSTAIGSLAGGLMVALIFGLSAGRGLALSAGFGWYSLSGVLISDMGDPLLGSAAFLANMIREALALLLIPLLAASGKPYTAIGAGGATAMDVTLPLIEQCVGPEAVPVSFTSGALLSLLVPVLVPLFFRLG